MPPNDPKPSLGVATRAYSYEAGEVGPVLAREIAVETPIEIRFGGAPFAVMMATPADLEDFAVGFALSEGIIERLDDIRAIEFALRGPRADRNFPFRRADQRASRAQEGDVRPHRLRGLRHRGSCASARAAKPAGHCVHTRTARDRRRPAGPGMAQPLNARTRAVHAAAWCEPDGAIRCVREDVGRHNALDKLIGALLRAGVDPKTGFLLITSRCSFEMVAKAAAFGAGVLVSVSAPTSLALRTAEASGVMLIAIARNDHALAFIDTNRPARDGAAA